MHIFDPYELTGLKTNHLGFGGLDRGAELYEAVSYTHLTLPTNGEV